MTNLRRKVKQAKKDLERLNNNPPRSTYEIIESIKKRNELIKVINYKKKSHEYNYKDVNNGLNYNNLTYLSLEVDMKVLLQKISPNGRFFSEQEVDVFLEEGLKRILAYAKKVSKRKPEKKMPLHSNYILHSSESKTKQKTITLNYLYRQEVGSEMLRPYAMNSKVDNE